MHCYYELFVHQWSSFYILEAATLIHIEQIGTILHFQAHFLSLPYNRGYLIDEKSVID